MEHDNSRTLAKGVMSFMVIEKLGLYERGFMVKRKYSVPVLKGDGHYCNFVNVPIMD